MRADVGHPLSSDTLFVYPTALKADDVARSEARRNGCLLGHRITTFPQLVDALARDLGVGSRVLEPHLAAVVLARAVERSGVSGALRTPGAGLLRELLSLIEELEAACLGPADVAALATGLGDPASAARIADIARVYRSYADELAQLRAVDRRGRERAVWEQLVAAEAAGGRRPAALAGVRRIVFAELYDFSALQFLLATSLIRLIGDAELIAFAHPENVDATRFVERTWNRFVADASISEQVLPSFVARGGRQGNLAAALRGVFAGGAPEPVAPDGSIRMVAAPGRYAEVETAVRDIRRRLERGEPAERIAIIVRDLAVYGELIEDVCRRYRVPVYFRKGRPLLASGIVGACLDVLRCVTEGFPRVRLAAILESDYFRAHGASLGRTLARIGFGSERARRLAECLAHEGARLEQRAATKTGPERAVVEAQHERLARQGRRLEQVVAALRPLDGRRSFAAHARMLARTLRRLEFRAVASADLSPFAARRDALAAALLEETLAGLAGLTETMRLGPIGLDEFVRTLVAALEGLEIEDRSERAGSVRALGVLDARGLDFDAVYVLGLDDGTFPAARSESPLCPDALKRQLNPLAAGRLRATLAAHVAGLPLGGLLRTARESSLEEPFLFFLALSMAERELVLSYPTADERGSTTVRSPFLDEVDACLGGGLVPERADPGRIVPELRDACEPAELIDRAALERWTCRVPDRLTPALRADAAVGAARLQEIDRRARIEERRARYFLARRGDEKESLTDAFVGRLGAAAPALAGRLDGLRWQPTALEWFAACGFKFFAARVLGLEESLPAGLEVDFRERGILFHAIVAELFRRHPVLPADLDAARALAREQATEVRRLVAHTIGAKDLAFLDVEWGQLERALDGVVVREHAIQQGYAADGITVEHLVERDLTTTFGTMTVTGRPDRVELHRKGGALIEILVRDYKVSAERDKFGKLAGEELGRTSLQIPLYLLLALAHVGAAGRDAKLGGSYVLARAIPEKQIVECAITPELLGTGPAGEGASILHRLADLVGRARAGRFDVDPQPCDPYCAFRGVCRYQEPPLEEEEAEDV
jgi:hypothetical protein